MARMAPRPEGSIEARWKSRSCEKIRAEIRATINSIAFIERTYRGKDPEYADFSIGQQQRILGGLDEEWAKSECREPPPIPAEKVRK